MTKKLSLEDALRDPSVWRGLERTRSRRSEHVTQPPDEFRSRLRARAREEQEAEVLVDELLRVTAARAWFAAAARMTKYHTHAVVRALLAAADRIFDTEPQNALERVRLAIYLAGFLPESAETSLLLGFAYKELANALWNVNRYLDAQAAADQAESFYRGVHGTEEHVATVNLVRSIILQRMRVRLDEAEDLLDRAAATFLEFSNENQWLKARLAKGMLKFARGQYDEARQVFEELVALAPVPRLAAQIHNNLAHCFVELGRCDLAKQSFELAIVSYLAAGMPVELARPTWGLARIEFEEGRIATALSLYRKAQQQFLKDGRSVESAVVSLEIIEVLLAIEDLDGASIEASAMPELFASAGMPTRAIEAANYVREITRLRRARPDSLRSIRRYVAELSAHPELEFVPPPGV